MARGIVDMEDTGTDRGTEVMHQGVEWVVVVVPDDLVGEVVVEEGVVENN